MKYRELLRDDRGNPIAHFKGNNLYQDIKLHFEVREMCDKADKSCQEFFDWLDNYKVDKPLACPECNTELKSAAGIGEFCPNKKCKVADGPFDGSSPILFDKPTKITAGTSSSDNFRSIKVDPDNMAYIEKGARFEPIEFVKIILAIFAGLILGYLAAIIGGLI